MSTILEIARNHKRAVEELDSEALGRQIAAFNDVIDAILAAIAQLMAERQRSIDAGEEVGVPWLLRRNRLDNLLAQAKAALESYGGTAAAAVEEYQSAAVAMASAHAEAAVAAQINGEPNSEDVALEWNDLPTEALTNLIGVLADGTPLADRFAELAADAVPLIRSEIIRGFALGNNPRQMAARVSQQAGKDSDGALNVTIYNAMRITRTETLRAYREASQEFYRQNDDVVECWIWTAAKSGRTCAACLAMDGTEHPLDEAMASHVCCRCTPTPKTKSWAQLLGDDFADLEDTHAATESGAEWFGKQSAKMQDGILGSSAAGKAYRAGTVSLTDFVGVRDNATYGRSVYTRSLKSALAAAESMQDSI